MRSLSIAATGMLAQQLNVEVISNNIANMNTTAYKRQRAEFQDLLYQDQRRVGSTSSDAGTVVPAGIQLGLGVRTAAVYRIPSQGNLTLTDAPLDIALQGKGYFQVTLPSGDVAYTRAGSFQLSANGEIVTPDGYLLQPSISIPKTALGVTINVSGEVLVDTGTTTPTTAGQIQVATFANEVGLVALGQNLLKESPASGSPQTGTPGSTGFGTTLQGFLETSNVDVVSEITNLITAQRAYEMNSKVIETSDQMLQTATNLR
ncbi:MAG: flagellar basal-body rod protein FlgG [Rhodospirillaceae bacterium]|jgi:flagellar basal-body rod protein FlgG|nr:flagellar basal-body rod protein FlgG [Rhodospirillaceae bacterium]MBT5659092.1 flagellar basal-body rod protein FlgG [Rhodospirillaceae bacterium]MBT5751741.1 flagellar basal-body rod protein FlgG [Rhodospirillaceae bacterium]